MNEYPEIHLRPEVKITAFVAPIFAKRAIVRRFFFRYNIEFQLKFLSNHLESAHNGAKFASRPTVQCGCQLTDRFARNSEFSGIT